MWSVHRANRRQVLLILLYESHFTRFVLTFQRGDHCFGFRVGSGYLLVSVGAHTSHFGLLLVAHRGQLLLRSHLNSRKLLIHVHTARYLTPIQLRQVCAPKSRVHAPLDDPTDQKS